MSLKCSCRHVQMCHYCVPLLSKWHQQTFFLSVSAGAKMNDWISRWYGGARHFQLYLLYQLNKRGCFWENNVPQIFLQQRFVSYLYRNTHHHTFLSWSFKHDLTAAALRRDETRMDFSFKLQLSVIYIRENYVQCYLRRTNDSQHLAQTVRNPDRDLSVDPDPPVFLVLGLHVQHLLIVHPGAPLPLHWTTFLSLHLLYLLDLLSWFM